MVNVYSASRYDFVARVLRPRRFQHALGKHGVLQDEIRLLLWTPASDLRGPGAKEKRPRLHAALWNFPDTRGVRVNLLRGLARLWSRWFRQSARTRGSSWSR